MHVDVSYSKQRGKIYKSVLLRQTYRKNGKIGHKTIANLSRCSSQEIEAIKLALKYKKDLSVLGNIKEIKTEQGFSVGAVVLLYQLSKRLRIEKTLGFSKEGKLILWQVIARLIQPFPKLASVRLASRHAALEILGMEAFNEDDVYEALSWLEKEQGRIEKQLYEKRYRKQGCGLFLYDVTSTYLEGDKNELADFGYNRDKKRGKKQIVIGLLTDEEGEPVSVQVYSGETSDLISAEIVHSRYKDLGLVEWAFRDMKTEHLEIRPVNVRKGNHTRAHVFIVMLAYLIRRELERCWQEVEVTVKEGIDELSQLCSVFMKYDVERFQSIPSPRSLGKKLLELAGVKLPDDLPLRKKNVYTRKKIAGRRKLKKVDIPLSLVA